MNNLMLHVVHDTHLEGAHFAKTASSATVILLLSKINLLSQLIDNGIFVIAFPSGKY
jgi:hypothetical protein